MHAAEMSHSMYSLPGGLFCAGYLLVEPTGGSHIPALLAIPTFVPAGVGHAFRETPHELEQQERSSTSGRLERRGGSQLRAPAGRCQVARRARRTILGITAGSWEGGLGRTRPQSHTRTYAYLRRWPNRRVATKTSSPFLNLNLGLS